MLDYLQIKYFLLNLLGRKFKKSIETDNFDILSDEYEIRLYHNDLIDLCHAVDVLSKNETCVQGHGYFENLIYFNDHIDEMKFYNRLRDNESIIVFDDINRITYEISKQSETYALYIFLLLLEKSDLEKFKYRWRNRLDRIFRFTQNRGTFQKHINSTEVNYGLIFTSLIDEFSLKISSTTENNIFNSLDNFEKLTQSMLFHLMYKYNVNFLYYVTVEELISENSPSDFFESFDTLKNGITISINRCYDSEAFDYYMLAMGTKDPFIQYISYYHVLEYYFEKVLKYHLTQDIKQGFESINNFNHENKEHLERIVTSVMSTREMIERNQIEETQLQFLVQDYVVKNEEQLEALKERINSIKSSAVDFYARTKVPFASDSVVINWNSLNDCSKNISRRIYKTRNALVHSKKDRNDDRYSHFDNKKELLNEIPLIKAVSEIILMSNGSDFLS